MRFRAFEVCFNWNLYLEIIHTYADAITFAYVVCKHGQPIPNHPTSFSLKAKFASLNAQVETINNITTSPNTESAASFELRVLTIPVYLHQVLISTNRSLFHLYCTAGYDRHRLMQIWFLH